MRMLGIDYGEARIGVAVTDPLGIAAHPIEVIKKQKSFDDDLVKLKEVIDRYDNISEIVIGLPKNLKGEIGPQAEKALKFIDFLKSNISIPITTWDERMTTVIAQKSLHEAGLNTRKQRGVIDKVAASLILESYMNRKNK